MDYYGVAGAAVILSPNSFIKSSISVKCFDFWKLCTGKYQNTDFYGLLWIWQPLQKLNNKNQ